MPKIFCISFLNNFIPFFTNFLVVSHVTLLSFNILSSPFTELSIAMYRLCFLPSTISSNTWCILLIHDIIFIVLATPENVVEKHAMMLTNVLDFLLSKYRVAVETTNTTSAQLLFISEIAFYNTWIVLFLEALMAVFRSPFFIQRLRYIHCLIQKLKYPALGKRLILENMYKFWIIPIYGAIRKQHLWHHSFTDAYTEL